jgi:glyoxylase-like metal-dependent hydrolase (beta-lactamase superfamily II)
MSIQQLSEHVYYLAGGVNTILLKQEDKAIFVDTGGDKTYGRDLKRACESLNITPIAILNTHSHADHYGGNDYLIKQYELPVYAPAFESSIIQNPSLEPIYLYGGAKPLPELMSKWLLAKPSKVDFELGEGTLELAGLELKVIDTSGHAHKHMSIICDDVLIAADALFGETVLEKYPLPFGQDISAQIASAKKLLNKPVKLVVPGHGEPSDDLASLIKINLETFEKASEIVLDSARGVGTEEVLRLSCNRLGISIADLPRYYLNLCVINAYLGYLRDLGKVTLELKNNALCWAKVKA